MTLVWVLVTLMQFRIVKIVILLQQTKARNAARAEINDRTQMMVQSAIDAVTVANSSNQEKIKMAQQSVLSLIAQAKQQSSRPVLVGGGGGGKLRRRWRRWRRILQFKSVNPYQNLIRNQRSRKDLRVTHDIKIRTIRRSSL